MQLRASATNSENSQPDERRSTLTDVARLARVSTATASRALANSPLISAKTRAAVLRAAERAAYRPNLIARSLRTQQAHAIVVLVPDLDNSFFPEIIRGMEAKARERGYSLLLGLTRRQTEVEKSYVELVQSSRADGILVMDGGLKHLMNGRESFSIPAVQVVERLRGIDLPWVGIDDRTAAMKAVRHLTDLGHRRIGHLCGPRHYSVTADRIAGYCAALTAAGIAHDRRLVARGGFTAAGGETATRQLLALPNPPTAIFCGNDESAHGALRHLRNLGLKVPRDMSLVSFDDVPSAASAEPPLTTLRQPRYDLGVAAMTMLLDILAGATNTPRELVLPVDMILRESTAPYRGH